LNKEFPSSLRSIKPHSDHPRPISPTHCPRPIPSFLHSSLTPRYRRLVRYPKEQHDPLFLNNLAPSADFCRKVPPPSISFSPHKASPYMPLQNRTKEGGNLSFPKITPLTLWPISGSPQPYRRCPDGAPLLLDRGARNKMFEEPVR